MKTGMNINYFIFSLNLISKVPIIKADNLMIVPFLDASSEIAKYHLKKRQIRHSQKPCLLTEVTGGAMFWHVSSGLLRASGERDGVAPLLTSVFLCAVG